MNTSDFSEVLKTFRADVAAGKLSAALTTPEKTLAESLLRYSEEAVLARVFAGEYQISAMKWAELMETQRAAIKLLILHLRDAGTMTWRQLAREGAHRIGAWSLKAVMGDPPSGLAFTYRDGTSTPAADYDPVAPDPEPVRDPLTLSADERKLAEELTASVADASEPLYRSLVRSDVDALIVLARDAGAPRERLEEAAKGIAEQKRQLFDLVKSALAGES
jgi:hypothetical protein